MQQLRRVERAAGDDHLGIGVRRVGRAALAVFHAHGAPAGKQHTRRQRVGGDREIGPPLCGLEIADRGRPAASVLGGELEIAGAFLGGAVEVVVARVACLLRGLDEGLAQRVRLAHIGDSERPAAAVHGVGATLLVLGAPEKGQHVFEAPAFVAELAPVVVVLVLAAHIEQAVDRARSAQHLAARLDDLAVVELGLRLRLVEPVDLGIVEQLAVAERNVDPNVAVAAAGFQQQHAVAAGRREAIGQHAAGRARADDDVVESFRGRRHRVSACLRGKTAFAGAHLALSHKTITSLSPGTNRPIWSCRVRVAMEQLHP